MFEFFNHNYPAIMAILAVLSLLGKLLANVLKAKKPAQEPGKRISVSQANYQAGTGNAAHNILGGNNNMGAPDKYGVQEK